MTLQRNEKRNGTESFEIIDRKYNDFKQTEKKLQTTYENLPLLQQNWRNNVFLSLLKYCLAFVDTVHGFFLLLLFRSQIPFLPIDGKWNA